MNRSGRSTAYDDVELDQIIVVTGLCSSTPLFMHAFKLWPQVTTLWSHRPQCSTISCTSQCSSFQCMWRTSFLSNHECRVQIWFKPSIRSALRPQRCSQCKTAITICHLRIGRDHFMHHVALEHSSLVTPTLMVANELSRATPPPRPSTEARAHTSSYSTPARFNQSHRLRLTCLLGIQQQTHVSKRL